MSYIIYEGDSTLAKRNRVLVSGCGGMAYNAVLSVSFSNEDELEPVTLKEARDWLRVDINDEDNLITSLISAARITCENYANLSFIERTVTAKIHNGLGNFVLPYGPVVGSITSATDIDDLELTDFRLSEPYDKDITVVYDAGFSDEIPFPDNLRTALLNQVAYLYENRGDAQKMGGVSPLSLLILKQVRFA